MCLYIRKSFLATNNFACVFGNLQTAFVAHSVTHDKCAPVVSLRQLSAYYPNSAAKYVAIKREYKTTSKASAARDEKSTPLRLFSFS